MNWRGRAKFKLIVTNNYKPWTQPAARNLGAKKAKTNRYLFLDVDHVLTTKVVKSCEVMDPLLCRFKRFFCDLDKNGVFSKTNKELLPNPNNFYIHKRHWIEYDESFCGKYGSDDSNWFSRQNIPITIADSYLGVLQGKEYKFHNLSREEKN